MQHIKINVIQFNTTQIHTVHIAQDIAKTKCGGDDKGAPHLPLSKYAIICNGSTIVTESSSVNTFGLLT